MPHEPAYDDSLDGTLAGALDLIDEGVADRRSPFHTPTLATVRADGSPSLRTVILRGFARESMQLWFHTDRRSPKLAEIARDPRVAFHVYDPAWKVQIRIDGVADAHRGDEAARAAWQAAAPPSRECYRIEPGPSVVIDDPARAVIGPAPADPDAGFANFVLVAVAISGLEWLDLAAAGHRRARFSWRGASVESTWLAP